MEAGLLERVMTGRFGRPLAAIRDGMGARVWNVHRPDDEGVLYIGMKWRGLAEARFRSLKAIYGDCCGGYLIMNSLKVAILLPTRVYGVWNIDDLRAQPEVQHAITRDPAVDYFMDEHNVLFYGVKRGDLYVFDSETDELDCLGPVEPALEAILANWETILEEE